MYYDYEDWNGDDLELTRDLLGASQQFLDVLFERLGINKKPVASVVYFRTRGSFNFNEGEWDTEIFQRKIIYKSDNQISEHNEEKIFPIENYLLPKDQEKITKNLAKNYINEVTPLSNNNKYLFFANYCYKEVVGGTKHTESVYDHIDDKYIEIPPTYGIDDGLITSFTLSKDIKKEIENFTFLLEVFKLITKRTFSNETKIEDIDKLLVKAGITALNDKIYQRFLDDQGKKKCINLFDSIHNISLLRYESSENHGNLLFCSRDIEIANKIIFSKPISLTEYSSATTIRKLLEISSGNISLLCDGEFIFGIGQRDEMQNLPKKFFAINFKGQGKWDVVTSKNEKVMSVAYRVPTMPKASLKEAEFAEQFKKTFDSLEYTNVWGFIDVAKKQAHGTMVVVTKAAEGEAKRLCNQSFSINKTDQIQNSLIKRITAIDGAVLLDNTGVCHAIGVILDGIVNERIGTISRGARYNSALRYLNYSKENSIPCLIVIVSEDKYIDIKTIHDV
ncbi:diadenylate cyclase [Priestia megaterium]|uniref:diadenylate cyclase n=1 Tax=Priestia megaterium TaxID=1404 RepID=UPI001C244D5E|nr:diadenylate cyclase [Priestia megaterium]MBU8689486.1 diadenylate cyclase [Priestia megaterium]